MHDAPDDALHPESGLITPPLSPSRTASTDGSISPRTRASPRKTRSCYTFHDIERSPRTQTLTDPSADVKRGPCLSGLLLAGIPRFDPRPASPPTDADFPIKRQSVYFDSSTDPRFPSFSLSPNHSPPIAATPSYSDLSPLSRSPALQTLFHDQSSPSLPETVGEGVSSKNTSISGQLLASSAPLTPSVVETDVHGQDVNAKAKYFSFEFSLTELRRLNLRSSNSPLRPSQWTARGGLLPSSRRLSRAPDRFISSRRSPAVNRESFEVNKPAKHLTADERVTRNSLESVDPFSRRLRRSGRLDDELRSLREAHSILTRRANFQRHGVNASIRRGSVTLGSRQVSAGGVWNVGGTSPVSDTVLGVSNGRGGILGSGTNAPLYTSMFLSRSDPEAELEAYERRLALALEVNQADRVLEHSTPTSSPVAPNWSNPQSPTSRTRHVWRDSSWTEDGVAPRLCSVPTSLDSRTNYHHR